MSRSRLTAKTADRHVLYQKAVQSADAEVDFCRRLYRKHYDVAPTRFREDFCGTALICCEWVRRNRANHAYGIDLDKPTLDWGRKYNLVELSEEARRRVHLIQGNVLDVSRPKVHIVGAFNFSYAIFKTHDELSAYFKTVRRSILPKGLFVLDAYGGYEAQQVCEEKTRHNGFTYIWDQAEYNPINDHTLCHIHFKFPDGTMLRRAFTYDWRLWTLGSIQDTLLAAGFKKTEVYWEGTAGNGDGNGVYRPTNRAENTPGWTAYIIGLP